MNSIEAYLQQIGLSPSEVTLYLAGLKLGETGVNELVFHTSIKRPTAYHALNALVTKGLANETKTGRELVYVMRPPTDITGYLHTKIGDLSEQERQLAAFLPLFPKQSVQSDTKLSVHQYHGEGEVRRLIDMALYCQRKRWDIIAPKDNFIASSDAAYIQYFKKTREMQGIVSRSLWEQKLGRGELNLHDIISRKPRYLPQEYIGRFKSMMILFDDSVAMISSYDQQEGLLIESSEYYDLLKILFEGLWIKADKP